MTQGIAQFLLLVIGLFLLLLGSGLITDNLPRAGRAVLALAILFMLPALFTLVSVALFGGAL